MNQLLSADDVSVAFGGVRALDGVSLEVAEGAIIGLLGPNGAGKSTLFGVLSGLLRPNHGSVFIDGVDVTDASPQARVRRGLARTFQRPELFGDLTVREHLVLARRIRLRRAHLWRDLVGLDERRTSAETAEVDALLHLLGLVTVGDLPATALGLGTARLVEVARALATKPRVLLLDEPSSGLDADETTELTEVLRRLSHEQGLALLLVEHDVALVLSLADHVTVLDFGKVIAAGPASEIRQDVAVQRAYLGAAP